MDTDLYKGTCVIVDDELRSRNNIALLIKQYLPGLEVLGMADGGTQAREILSKVTPDILFLDVQMPGEDGFDLLESLETKDFALVFVTAFEKYALRAIKVSAIDYVLKPIEVAALQEATQKGLALKSQNNPTAKVVYQKSIGNFLETLESKDYPKRITLPFKGSYIIRELGDLKYLVADSNYTQFNFSNEEPILVARTMKYFTEVLDPELFIRCNRSTIVNFKHLKEVNGNTVLLIGGEAFPISRRKKTLVLTAFQKYWNHK